MNKFEMIERVEDTVATLMEEVKVNKEAGKSIGRLQRKAKLLGIIGELIEAYAPEEFTLKTGADLEQALNPKKGKRVVFDIQEGSNVIELLDKYNNVKDVYRKIMAQADAMGLKLVGSTLVKK